MNNRIESNPAFSPTRLKSIRAADSVNRVYQEIKELAVEYRFRPGQKVNEVELAEKLGVSRTPVREALNRLVRDGFMSFVPNKGFYARELSADTVRQLYELRAAIECGAYRLACVRATDQEIEDAVRPWESATDPATGFSQTRMAEADEAFHMAVARLSKNPEMIDALERINARIRFFRRTDMETQPRRQETFGQHARIIGHLRRREPEAGALVLEQHVTLSSAHAILVTKEVVARIFLGPAA